MDALKNAQMRDYVLAISQGTGLELMSDHEIIALDHELSVAAKRLNVRYSYFNL